jgi:hypothetical protein
MKFSIVRWVGLGFLVSANLALIAPAGLQKAIAQSTMMD